jgi:uncharacterized NAD(P)/FAD-binding protein YdhS
MSEVVAFPQPHAPRAVAGGRGCRIAVVGAGFSGALVAIHLWWRCRPGERVYLVERSGAIGQGLAYATPNPRHLLNVRVENMSAFADEPDHFIRWLDRLPAPARAAAAVRTAAGTFVRRGVYGDYIRDLIRDSITRLGGAPHLYMVPDEACALRPTRSGLDLETGMGRVHSVDAAVLALGNFPPDQERRENYFGNPWESGATDRLDPQRPVLLIGSGLTMIDVCLDLLERGFGGPIIAVSRRGLLPQPHGTGPTWDGLRLDAADRSSLSSLMHAVRREIAIAREHDVDWRAVIDAIRPHAQLLWQEMRPADKRRFLRHLRPWWESHRHRIAPTVARAIGAARRRGQLELLAGRIEGMDPAERGGVIVRWRPRGADAGRTTTVQRVINCAGPGTDLTRLDDPLVRQLLGDGLARTDAYGLGLDTTPAGAVVGGDGAVSPHLFAVGPVTRGAFWEITSVADIRVQAEQVAISVLAAARRAAAIAA